MTRLELLCILHRQQGGTIFDFNRLYGYDLLVLTNFQFKMLLASKFGFNTLLQYWDAPGLETETLEGVAKGLKS